MINASGMDTTCAAAIRIAVIPISRDHPACDVAYFATNVGNMMLNIATPTIGTINP